MPTYSPGAMALDKLDLGGWYMMTIGRPELKEFKEKYSMSIPMASSYGLYWFTISCDENGEPLMETKDGKYTNFHLSQAIKLALSCGLIEKEGESFEWNELDGKVVCVQLGWSKVDYSNQKSYFNVQKIISPKEAEERRIILGPDPALSEPVYQESEQGDPF